MLTGTPPQSLNKDHTLSSLALSSNILNIISCCFKQTLQMIQIFGNCIIFIYKFIYNNEKNNKNRNNNNKCHRQFVMINI